MIISPYVAALLAMMNVGGGVCVIGNKNRVTNIAKKAKR